jgi:hypothetical protein
VTSGVRRRGASTPSAPVPLRRGRLCSRCASPSGRVAIEHHSQMSVAGESG